MSYCTSMLLVFFKEEILLSGIRNEFKENVQYICVALELDTARQESRINVQIILHAATNKYRPFIEPYTCK